MILAPNRSRSTYPLALSALLVPSLFAAPALANSFITVTGEATVESNARLGEAAPFDTDATGAPLPVDAAVISSGAFGDRLTASVEGQVPDVPNAVSYGGRSSVGGVLSVENANTVSTSLFSETFWQAIGADELGGSDDLDVRGSAEYRAIVTLDTDVSAVIDANVTGTNSAVSLFSGTNETIAANRLFSLSSDVDASALEAASDSLEVELSAGTYLLLLSTFSPFETMGVASGRSAAEFALLATRAQGLDGGTAGGVATGGGSGGNVSPVPSPTAAAGGLALLGLGLLRRRNAA